MKWKQFLEVAYPAAVAVPEAHRSVVYKTNRWIGLGLGYVFYHLKISANTLSITRLAIAFVGLYLLSLVATGHTWQPLVGVLMLVSQFSLDAADGAVARVEGKTSKLGDKLDGLVNAAARAAVLVLAGFLANDSVLLLVSAFATYVLITFIPDTGMRIRSSGKWRPLAVLYRTCLFVPVMVFVLPLVIALHGALQLPVAPSARIIVMVYAFLAGFWLLLCLLSANTADGPLERIPEARVSPPTGNEAVEVVSSPLRR